MSGRDIPAVWQTKESRKELTKAVVVAAAALEPGEAMHVADTCTVLPAAAAARARQPGTLGCGVRFRLFEVSPDFGVRVKNRSPFWWVPNWQLMAIGR